MTERAPIIYAPLRGFSLFKGPISRVIVESARSGSPYLIEREPTNPVDQLAIKVIDPETNWHFAYIASPWNQTAALFMDKGWIYQCTCVQEPICRRENGRALLANDSFIVRLNPIAPLVLKKSALKKEPQNV